MVDINDTNPKCPKCQNHCGSDYRCKFCNCNMHWFCSADNADGSELGHGAHYVCSNCGSKKHSSAASTTPAEHPSSKVSSQRNKTLSQRNKTATDRPSGKAKASLQTKKCSSAKAKASSKSKKAIQTERPSAVAKASSGHHPNLAASQTKEKETEPSSGEPCFSKKKGRKPPSSKASRTKKKVTKHPPRTTMPKKNSSSNSGGLESSIGVLDNAFNRAITLPSDDISPIAKQLFERTLANLPTISELDFMDSSESLESSIDLSVATESTTETPTSDAFDNNDTPNNAEFDDGTSEESSSDQELHNENGEDNSEQEEHLHSRLQDNWDVIQPNESNKITNIHNNRYINQLVTSGGIHINHQNKYEGILSKPNFELKLFFSFITKSYFCAVYKWTNQKIQACQKVRAMHLKKYISRDQFFAYVGLELGMSILQCNAIDQYWNTGLFQGHTTFQNTMSRNRFELIRSQLCFANPEQYNHEVASKDPLWHSRSLLEHFTKNCAEVATPIGPSALDECSARTKARTAAKTFNKNKPAKFAVRFYAVTGSVNPYISSLYDNRAGNKTGIPAAIDYCRIFRSLRTPYNNVFHPDLNLKIEKDSPSALWMLQMAHQTKAFPDPSGKRIFFTDNFYTRHNLAHSLKVITDGEARMIGTVRFSNVDCTNRYFLQKAIEDIDGKPRGSWCLVRAYDEHPELSKLQRQHQNRNKDKGQTEKQKFIPPTDLVASNAGYIVFKDSKVVIFYTNDLAGTPDHAIMDGTLTETAMLCHGVSKIHRWTGCEIMKRTCFEVPVQIIAYNMFMNGVDRMDQLRSTNITQRREKRLYMTMFTMCLDLAIHQAYCLYNALCPTTVSKKHKTLLSFKHSIAQALVLPEMTNRMRRKNNPVQPLPNLQPTARNIHETLGRIEEGHMLVRNLGKNKNPKFSQDSPCYLCKLRGFISKTIYGCPGCQSSFHVECFTAFHYKDALKGNMRAVIDMLKASEMKGKSRKRRSSYVGTLDTLQLPPAPIRKPRRILQLSNTSESSSSTSITSTNSNTSTTTE